MKEIIFVAIFFLFVTLSHAFFLLWGKNKKDINSNFLWNVHLVVNGILWLILFSWIMSLQFRFHDFQPAFWMQILGLFLFLPGAVLVVSAFNKLGLKKAMGRRFFSKEKQVWISRGIYAKLANPMYDGFILIMVGIGLFLGIVADFFLALVSYLLLNIFLASIENQKEV